MDCVIPRFKKGVNKISKLSRNGKIAIASLCIVVVVMAVGIFAVTNHNSGTTQSVVPGTVPSNTSSTNAASDYTSKVNSISNDVNSTLNDSYTVLEKYANGAIDESVAISRLQSDKEKMSQSLSEIQTLNPPQNMQTFHNLVVSAFKDLESALTLEVSGLKNSDPNDLQSAADLTDSAISKLNKAEQETNQTN